MREYLAVVHGELPGKGILRGYYEKDERRNIAVVLARGQTEIVTEYDAVRVRDGRTLVKVRPVTGRSHQIRAHLASIGHPLCGDRKYGGEATPYAPAQLLHCGRVTLEGITYEAAPPEGFQRCVRDWFGV
jgi:23S rRNA pseudouridine955/2504/2580 synthase